MRGEDIRILQNEIIKLVPDFASEQWAFGDVLMKANGYKTEIQSQHGVLFIYDDDNSKISLQEAEARGYFLKERI